MLKINNNFDNISESYLFSTISKRVAAFRATHPESEIIRLGIGDVTLPICSAAVDELVKAAREQGVAGTFEGYGPEQGYLFLRRLIRDNDYLSRGVELSVDEIFISDGAKSDIGNIGDILSRDNVVAITNPVYPVYVDTNIMAGREIMMLPCVAENGFVPMLPTGKVPDVIYLCYPNNPTGTSLRRLELKHWVDYALDNGALLLYDSAYEAYICSDDVPHSIFEIEGAKKCAIEFRSYSKTAGFTGLRCGYTIVPREIAGGKLNDMWRRRQCTKFNGASYVVQRAAAALYTEEGRGQVRKNIEYYMANARLLVDGLHEAGLTVYGGVDAPYIWAKTPGGVDSWSFFDTLLDKCGIVATPGVGFGQCGEGYMRFTSFNTRENTVEAVTRIKNML